MFGTVELFGRSIALVSRKDPDQIVKNLSALQGRAVHFCNVHMLMLSREDAELARAMDDAAVNFADGVPVAWLQSRLSRSPCSVVRGYEIMRAVCGVAEREGSRIGFLGSTQSVLDRLITELGKSYPRLDVAYKASPPYAETELITRSESIADIRAAHLDWLFVGLGCPKQEKWIHRYGSSFDCPVLGVGAAFDWLAGTVPMPPRWMERAGLGWLFRLLQNPRRMWRRYIIYNTKFIFSAVGLLMNRNPVKERP